ncbi:MAG TPA: phytoene desaturase family protein [Nocardia sp.]|uniref:phytoene desaturase family protein n=1 Tax=Nocardia sp. TaxID=1821 RepID=UPI002B4B5FB9|nr:phytoene desaturase family protein [Nocardia sp.]HLS77643.1 phytoene desaturase family protein [Nocardia sp.]
MKTVAGPTDRIVVVGAGLSGLAAALHLTGAGRQVTVFERADHPGGRVGHYTGQDYRIDSGATVLTLPELVDEALAAVGHTRASAPVPLEVLSLTPSYHARFADGSEIRVFADEEAMAREVARTCGAPEAERYRRLRAWLADIYRAEFAEFMDDNFDSPLDMVRTRAKRAALLDLVRLGGFGRLGAKIDRLLTDRRLSRLFTFQALYAGMAPADALAVYAAIPHMDTSLGVYFPRGGMSAVAATMASALTDAGGTLVCDSEVDRIEYTGKRATAVVLTDGSSVPCDAVVLTADLGSIERFGGRRRRGLRASPSAVVAHGTVPVEVAAAWPVQAHHTIDFGAAWEQTFREIATRRGKGRLMSDPSLLLTRPALTDPDLLITRPDGRHEPFSVLAPCPNLDSAPLDWDRTARPYLAELLAELERRGYRGIAEHFTVDHLDTPATWRDKGMLAGTPFAAAHLFRQTGPFRTRNMPGFADNVVLAGCGTVPGIGVPTVLLSGKLAAHRIVGAGGGVSGDTARTRASASASNH